MTFQTWLMICERFQVSNALLCVTQIPVWPLHLPATWSLIFLPQISPNIFRFTTEITFSLTQDFAVPIVHINFKMAPKVYSCSTSHGGTVDLCFVLCFLSFLHYKEIVHKLIELELCFVHVDEPSFSTLLESHFSLVSPCVA